MPDDAEISVQTHAWVEVAIPGWGWWAIDPTNHLAAGERHVKIGHGRDYDDVLPLTLTLSNPGPSGSSDVRLLGLRLRVEDGAGAGIVPSSVLDRVEVREE